jgi:hypothetical protein
MAMKGYQFSLRTLLAAVAAVGIGAALWVAEPSWQVGAIEALFLAFVPAAAVALAVHSSGTAKTWWIGNAIASAFAAILQFMQSTLLLAYDSTLVEAPFADLTRLALALSFKFHSAILALAFAPVVGLLCVLTHLALIRPPEPKD